MRRFPLVALVAIVAIIALSRHASPQTQFHHHWFHHDANYVFRNVTVEPGEVIDGNLNVLFGNAIVEGTVRGDLNVLGGSCDTSEGTVEGEVNCVQTASFSAIAPWVGSYTSDIPFAGESRHLSMTIFGNFIIFVMFLLFPMRVRLALARVETQPGLAAMFGLLAFVAVIPLAILLLLSIVGIPLIVLEIAAVFAGMWIGQAAIALLVGRRLSELVRPNSTPSPLIALLLGLVVVSAAEIVPVVGWVVMALMILVGLGAAILGFIPMGTAGVRRSIAGPPMTR
jgi:hypothetical protein